MLWHQYRGSSTCQIQGTGCLKSFSSSCWRWDLALAMASLLPPLIDWCRKVIKSFKTNIFPSPFTSFRLNIHHQHLLPCRCSSSAWTTSSGTHRSQPTKMAATSTRTTTSSMLRTSASTTVSLTCTLTQGNSRMKSFNCAYTCSNFWKIFPTSFTFRNNNTKYVIKPSLYCPTDTGPLTFSVFLK